MVAMISGGTLLMLAIMMSAAVCRGRGGWSVPARLLSHASRERPSAAALAFSAAACSSGSSITVIDPPRLHRINAGHTPVEGFCDEELRSPKSGAKAPRGLKPAVHHSVHRM